MTDYLHALPSGYRIEEYELVRVLGSGGFGITYLGYDHHLDKAVAIKEYLPNDLAVRTDNNSVLPKSTQDRADYEWGLKRFLNEAQTLARFDHRHIIKIHRFFRAHGTGYSVMEYAEGETLSALLQRKGTLTEAELKQLLFPILDGLEAVHEADFLHRDIKPGNIVIRDDSSPVLIDFGSARQAVAGMSRSVTAIVTPGYAPIEQYSAKGHQGPWTDIYGLGAVCYRCLTGEAPDDATERLRAEPLVPASKRCKGKANASMLDAIDRALRVDEGERPQTIAAWRPALSAEADAPAYRRRKDTTRPTARPSSPISQASRAGLLSKFLLAGVVLALVGVGIYWWRQNELLQDEQGSDVALARGTSGTARLRLMPAETGNCIITSYEEYFTRGSSEDDVLRLQGIPSGIHRYPDYETLWFGISSVKISSRWRCVLAWKNFGNLNVRFLPGKQVTSETYFTLGSHEDDVLRLQGTPSGIDHSDNINSPGLIDTTSYETLWFGSSTVKVDMEMRRVFAWSNNDDNLKVRLLPGKQVTSETYFTRGSHEDDVLRLQGTPSAIGRHPRYETLWFGESWVEIDLRTRRVLKWSNSDGNLKVKF